MTDRDKLSVLSLAMREALARLDRNMVWADGRSVRALIKRGLAANYGGGNDALIGTFRVDVLTPLGREVAAALKATAKEPPHD